MDDVDAPLTPLERRRLSRGDRIGVHGATEAVAIQDCSTAASTAAHQVFLGAAGRFAAQRRVLSDLDRKGLDTRPSDVWNHSSARRFDTSPNTGFEGARAACRRLLVNTIAIGRAVGAIRAAAPFWPPAAPTRCRG